MERTAIDSRVRFVRPLIPNVAFLSNLVRKGRSIMLLSKFWKDQSGATAVEYGIMVAAIAAVIIATVFVVGGQTQGAFNNLSTALAAAIGP